MVHFSVVVYCKSLKLCQPMLAMPINVHFIGVPTDSSCNSSYFFSRLPLVYVRLEGVCECVNPGRTAEN